MPMQAALASLYGPRYVEAKRREREEPTLYVVCCVLCAVEEKRKRIRMDEICVQDRVCTVMTPSSVCVRLYCQAIVNRCIELTSFILPLLLLALLLLLLLLPQVLVAVPREVEVG